MITDSSHFEVISLIQDITSTRTVIHQIKIVAVLMIISASHEKATASHSSYLLFQSSGSNINQIFSDIDIMINHKIKNQIFVLNQVITSSSHQETAR